MSKKIIIVVVLVVAILAFVGGYMIFSKDAPKAKKEVFSIASEEMYSNVKDSRKIVKIRVIVETTNKKDAEYLEKMKYQIRDISNEIIRATEEKDLVSPEAQSKLQEKIKKELINQMDIDSIENVRFSDFVIQ